MDLSKKIAIAAVIILLITVVCLICFKGDGESGTKIDKTPVNTSVDLNEVFKELEKIEGFESEEQNLETDEAGNIIENPVDENIDGSENATKQKEILNEANIDFGKYNVLEKKAIVRTTDDVVNEVWMIKLGDVKQQEDVARILGNRLQKLKNAFAEDSYQTAILNRAIIKQEDGIVIMVISPNEDEIEKLIAEVMRKIKNFR